jgi:hypothetical protein
MTKKVIVAAINSNGSPDFYFCTVRCTKKDFNNGNHYALAKQKAKDNGYEPMLAYDETDPGFNILKNHVIRDTIKSLDFR